MNEKEQKKEEVTIKDKVEKLDVVKGPLAEPQPLWMKILTAESPKKEVNEYLNHPLNFDQDKSTGKIIRGAEGIIGNLDRAIIDILIGVIEKLFKMFESKSREK